MDDILKRVSEERDFFSKIINKLPGFSGYVERAERRNADKLLRENIADRIESLWSRISEIQKDAISNGNIELIDELESSALKLRQFIDRVRTASYGYAGFFDPIRIRTEELDAIYQYDLTLLTLEEEISRAIDNVESSMGTDGLPAATSHLRNLAQQSLEVFNKRKDVIVNMSENQETE